MREKLIELLSEHCAYKEKRCVGCDADGEYYHPECRTELFGKIADHLIANGVTIQQWIPVTERLPDELPQKCCAWSEMVRPSVDVLVKMKGTKELYTAWYSYAHKEWTDVREEHSFTGVTHWMPLPEPPKGVE